MSNIHYIILCTCISNPSDMHTNYKENILPYKWQPGNAQCSHPLVVLYFMQGLGAWVPLANMSTPCPTTPLKAWVLVSNTSLLGGFAFISPVFRIHVLPLNYIQCITCTVKSPMSPTCVSFNLFNVLHVHVSPMPLTLQSIH